MVALLRRAFRRQENDNREDATAEAGPVAVDISRSDRLLVLIPSEGGLYFRLQAFLSVESATAYIEHHFPAQADRIVAFWALHRPYGPQGLDSTGEPLEAVVMVRDIDRPGVVRLSSFVDMQSANAFVRAEAMRGLNLRLVLIFWAAPVRLLPRHEPLAEELPEAATYWQPPADDWTPQPQPQQSGWTRASEPQPQPAPVAPPAPPRPAAPRTRPQRPAPTPPVTRVDQPLPPFFASEAVEPAPPAPPPTPVEQSAPPPPQPMASPPPQTAPPAQYAAPPAQQPTWAPNVPPAAARARRASTPPQQPVRAAQPVPPPVAQPVPPPVAQVVLPPVGRATVAPVAQPTAAAKAKKAAQPKPAAKQTPADSKPGIIDRIRAWPAWDGLAPRMVQASLLRWQVYEEIEKDPYASGRAKLVIGAAAVAAGIGGFWAGPAGMLLHTVFALGGWAAYIGLIWAMGTMIFAGRRSPGNNQRLFQALGLASAPGLLLVFGAFPIYGPLLTLAVLIWVLITSVVAIEPILELDRESSAIVAAVSWFGLFAIAMVLPAVLI